MKKIILFVLFGILYYSFFAQPYKNASLSIETRVNDLLNRMTPEEKFWQLFMIPGDLGTDKEKYKHGIFGFQVNTVGQNTNAAQQMLSYGSGENAYQTALKINEIQRFFIEESRLGIPIIPFDEALHGLVRSGATAFPQAIGLAATWNNELMHRVATAIAMECKLRGIRQILSPVVNIATDVRWGRTEETYGEDPFLVSEMGVAYVSAFEKLGIITTPKHFIANVGDGGRDSYPIHWNERLLREIYLPPFEACFKRGGSRSVMTSYNSYDGTPCTASNYLLNEILKKEWNFDGFVISDAGATGGANVLHMTATDYPDATAKSIAGGLDVIFQTDYDHYKLFSPPFYNGTIDTSIINKAVARVLRAKFELGLFEYPYINAELAKDTKLLTENRKLAKEAAQNSIVLLKNERKILPISKTIKSIAIIGSDAVETRLGGYSGPGNKPVSILDGIKNKLGNSVAVNYSLGCNRQDIKYIVVPTDLLSCTFDGKTQNGLAGEYFSNQSFSGSPAFIRLDSKIDFQWTLFSPNPEKLGSNFYSVRWSGKLKASETGNFSIGIEGNDGYKLFINNELIIDNSIIRTSRATLADFNFIKNNLYDIKIEFSVPTENVNFKLITDMGVKNLISEEIEKAVETAQKSDVAIVVVGIDEGEFQDRAYLNLPGRQEELIKRIAATGKPTIVVLVGGSAITMNNWLDEVQGVLAVWYPGDEGGNAIADVLFGDFNPCGRLPITYPVFEGQLPLVYNHKPTGRGNNYLNLTGEPLFPFSFGLSYTNFEYSDLKLSTTSILSTDSVKLSFQLKNTGSMAGTEIVQLYIRDEFSSVVRPVMELKGFKPVFLNVGETKEIEFTIKPEMLEMLDVQMKKVVEPGDFRIMIGASAKDIRLKTVLKVE